MYPMKYSQTRTICDSGLQQTPRGNKKKSKIQSIIGIKKVTNKYNSPMIPIQCIQWNIHRLVQYVTQASSKHHVEI